MRGSPEGLYRASVARMSPPNEGTPRRLPEGVAQIFNVPYRRIEFCGALALSSARESFDAPPITNRRYGRLKICATTVTAPVVLPSCALRQGNHRL